MTAADPFAAFPCLETERLLLRQVTPDDAEALFRVFSDDEVTRYYDLTPIVSQDEARALIERWRQRFASRQTIRWGITRRGEQRVLGTCGLGGDTWLAPAARADIGYDLARDCWRQGIMREALAAVLQFAFNRARLNRVGALVMPGNVASMRLLHGLGFQHEGLCGSMPSSKASSKTCTPTRSCAASTTPGAHRGKGLTGRRFRPTPVISRGTLRA